MSWLQMLNESYSSIQAKDDHKELWPIAHIKKNAHIEIVLDKDGNYLRANQLSGDDALTLIPVTEKSGARTVNIEPHPLSEELSYCALDLPDVKKKEERNNAYISLLKKWCESEHSHVKADAVLKFVNQGVTWKILNETFSFPIIFKSKSGQSTKIEPEKCFVRWRVEIPGVEDSTTWNDESLIFSWQSFEEVINSKYGFCYVTGQKEVRVANFHPKFVRNAADGARIITRNDWEGYTFLGRFTDEKDDVTRKNIPSQVCEVSFEVTQKAHNALRWLINRQATRNGDQAIVTWAISGKPVPEPMGDPFDFDEDDLSVVDDEVLATLTSTDSEKDLSSDLGQTVALKINKKRKGYYQSLGDTEQLSIMAIDSATPGRMAVTYYQEQLSKDYFSHLDDWYEHFSWYQRYNKEIKVEGKKPKSQLTWPIVPPSPFSIAQAAYGDVLKSQNTLKKQLYSRLLPCIAEGKPFPRDIVDLCVSRASNPHSGEHWEWERNVGVACALYRGYFSRHTEDNKRRKFDMALDENNHNRDYLYGRLLAVAERLEQIALQVAGENRATTAERFMQQFSERPFSTWRNIELALAPYKRRLQNNRAGFLANREKEITEITNLFDSQGYCDDSKLTGEFLLGYHAQKMSYRQAKNAEDKSE